MITSIILLFCFLMIPVFIPVWAVPEVLLWLLLVLAIVLSFVIAGMIVGKLEKMDNAAYDRQQQKHQELLLEDSKKRDAVTEWEKNAREAYKLALEASMQSARAECGEDVKLRIEYFDGEIERLDEAIAGLKATRQELYGRDVLYVKYREWSVCATMLEYLQAGRCEQLEGRDGTYNLYEAELRQNLIIRELTEIRRCLGRIQKTMYLMYRSIEQTNRHLDKLNEQVGNLVQLSSAQLREQVRGNSLLAVNTVLTAAVATNTEASKYLMLVQ